MPTWNDVSAAAPDLAAAVQARFDATGLAFLATLRRDGSPRISGIEPLFAGGELWLGMMDRSRKGDDLRHDPRLALHSATVDKEVKEGDAKLSGRAVEATDKATQAAFIDAFRAQTGDAPPEGPFDLFRVDVAELAFVRPGDDHLVIETWRAGGAPRRIERR